ncbi:MAG TPA: Ig-like domain-containing protein, partial [Longimicrobium sp.]|nr:Ig-like domain-containing protein [Longimicrobium sp.]
DGAISAVDALGVLFRAVGKPLPSGFAGMPYADVNCDGQATAVDALVILSHAVGRDVSGFCVGQAVLSPVRITAVPARPSAMAGDSVRFVATAVDSAGSAVDAAELVWTSSDTALASVDSTGLVRTHARGTVQITVAWAWDPAVRAEVALPIFTPLPPTTVVLDSTRARLVSDSAARAAGTFVFQLSETDPPAFSPGDVIVGSQGDGFLRRVQSVERSGSQVVAQTTDASLADAIPEGSFSVRTRLSSGSMMRGPGASAESASLSDPLCLGPLGTGTPEGAGANLIGYDLGGTVLYEDDDLRVTIPSGSLGFDPELDVGADWGPLKGFEFHAIASGALNLDLDVRAVASTSASFDGQKHLAHVCRRFTAPVGGIVITGRAELDLYALLHVGGSVVGTVQTGATSSASVSVGTRYQDGSWSGVGDASLNTSARPVTWNVTGQADVRVTLKPVLTIYLYDVAGPSFAALPYAGAEAGITSTNWKWWYRLGYGVDFELGATAKILNRDLGSWTHRLTGPSRTILADSGFLAIDSIRVTPGPVDTLDLYGLLDLTARAYVSNQEVEGTPAWSSSNPSVAVVNEHGNVDALAEGATYVTASALTRRDSVRVVVVSRSTLSKVSGDEQTGRPGEVLPDDLVVRARTQAGMGIPGVPVTFTVTAGGGSVSRTAAGTDANGLAAVQWTLGPGEGPQSLSASAPGLGAVTFTAASRRTPAAHPVAGGGAWLCVAPASAPARCLGRNPNGELGDGTNTDRADFTPVQSAHPFSALSAGGSFACGLDAGGKAFCWGSSGEGELGSGDRLPRNVPTEVLTSLTFTQIVSQHAHSCAIASTGDTWCWGMPRGGQLGNGYRNAPTEPVQVETAERFVQLAVGITYSCGLTAAGALYCWGSPPRSMGATELPYDCVYTAGPFQCATQPVPVLTSHRFRMITAAFHHTCGITQSGETYCWGDTPGSYVGTNYGLGDGTHAQGPTPVRVGPVPELVMLSAGGNSTCGLTAAGAAYCWGSNEHGQLGDGTQSSRLAPVPVAGGHAFRWIHTGGTSTCGVTAAGAVYCWGSLAWGSLGGPGFGPVAPGGSATPVRIPGLTVKVP